MFPLSRCFVNIANYKGQLCWKPYVNFRPLPLPDCWHLKASNGCILYFHTIPVACHFQMVRTEQLSKGLHWHKITTHWQKANFQNPASALNTGCQTHILISACWSLALETGDSSTNIYIKHFGLIFLKSVSWMFLDQDFVWFLFEGIFRLFRAFFWLCTQGTLLVGLRD